MQRIFLSLAEIEPLFSLMRTPVQPTVPSAPKLPTQAQPEAVMFFGTILKNGENFVLSDSVTKTSNTFGNPPKGNRYEMTVKATGTLHIARSLIRVETIQQIVGHSWLLLKWEVNYA
jgi:hypothetical protein